MIKICSVCKIEKDISEFHRQKRGKYGVIGKCKLCTKEYLFNYNKRPETKRKKKIFYIKNKEKIKQQHADMYIKNKEYIKTRTKIYQKEHLKDILKKHNIWLKKNPWKATLYQIRRRCNNPNNKDYPRYGGRGIECKITSEELKKLWFRNKAYLLNKPSIDRKDNDDHYTFDNCRYIEMLENAKKGNK